MDETTITTTDETTEAPGGTVGDIMQNAQNAATKKMVIFSGIGVYLAGIVYAEVHGFSILSKGVAPDFLFWAYLGMIALGVSAVALPLALHSWTFDAMHRNAALIFYVLDLALLGTNSFVDFGVNTGQALPEWADMYKTYIMPATPVIAAMGWSILFLLDPAQRMNQLKQTLRAAVQQALSQQIVQAAKSPLIAAEVARAAARAADDAVRDLFGSTTAIARPRSNPGENGKEPEPMPAPVPTPASSNGDHPDPMDPTTRQS